MKYPRLLSFRVRRTMDQLRGRRLLRSDHALWAGIQPAFRASQSTGCTFHELGLLYRHVVEQRPREVLELGAGISTIVLGYAAKRLRAEGHSCQITSMEENPAYFDDLRQLIPTEISDCVEIILSTVFDQKLDGQRVARSYAQTPFKAFDLVFIDGPQVTEAKTDPRYFDGDLLRAADCNHGPFVAYIDNRRTTRENLQALMPWASFLHDERHRFTKVLIPPLSERGDLGEGKSLDVGSVGGTLAGVG